MIRSRIFSIVFFVLGIALIVSGLFFQGDIVTSNKLNYDQIKEVLSKKGFIYEEDSGVTYGDDVKVHHWFLPYQDVDNIDNDDVVEAATIDYVEFPSSKDASNFFNTFQVSDDRIVKKYFGYSTAQYDIMSGIIPVHTYIVVEGNYSLHISGGFITEWELAEIIKELGFEYKISYS